MKKLAATLFFGALTTSAFAIPNIWYSSWAQGWIEYSISNSQGQQLWIACNEGWEKDTEHSIRLIQPNGQEFDEKLSFLINGVPFEPLSLPTTSIQGAGEWANFVQAISKATKFDIYKGNFKLAQFRASPQNVKKVASEIADCKSLWARED